MAITMEPDRHRQAGADQASLTITGRRSKGTVRTSSNFAAYADFAKSIPRTIVKPATSCVRGTDTIAVMSNSVP
jgi:hypothetical protein